MPTCVFMFWHIFDYRCTIIQSSSINEINYMDFAYFTSISMSMVMCYHRFGEKWNFHNCIGATDVKHRRIQAPLNSGSLYLNYKSKLCLLCINFI